MTDPQLQSLLVEILSAAFGVAGTVLLAMKGPRAGWGFVVYLASNAGWLLFAWSHGHWAMAAQQIAFTAASLFGIWRWLVAPEWPYLRWLYHSERRRRRYPPMAAWLAVASWARNE